MNEKLQLIREKCIAANPEIKTRLVVGWEDPMEYSIRLADVLYTYSKRITEMKKLSGAQDAIKQAISEGWIPHGMEHTPSLRTPDNVFANFYHQPTFLLDPLFWQALGKARHWLKRGIAWAAYDKWNEGREEMYYAHLWFKTRMSGGDEKNFWESLP